MGRIRNKSFTLVELIVAVGVVALVLPAIFNIFFVIIRQQIVLTAYQDMKRQGDSIAKNIKYILQNRASQITDDTYLLEVCPLITTPTPTYFPRIYIKDRDGNSLSIYQDSLNSDKIASLAALPNKKYFLNTTSVQISQTSPLAFSCYRVNDFTPASVSVRYTVEKSALFKSISLPYSFSVRLRNY